MSEFPVFSWISLSAVVPRASLRQAKITRAPRRAKSMAVNLPIPVGKTREGGGVDEERRIGGENGEGEDKINSLFFVPVVACSVAL